MGLYIELREGAGKPACMAWLEARFIYNLVVHDRIYMGSYNLAQAPLTSVVQCPICKTGQYQDPRLSGGIKELKMQGVEECPQHSESSLLVTYHATRVFPQHDSRLTHSAETDPSAGARPALTPQCSPFARGARPLALLPSDPEPNESRQCNSEKGTALGGKGFPTPRSIKARSRCPLGAR